jgi:hypothetical protein
MLVRDMSNSRLYDQLQTKTEIRYVEDSGVEDISSLQFSIASISSRREHTTLMS